MVNFASLYRLPDLIYAIEGSSSSSRYADAKLHLAVNADPLEMLDRTVKMRHIMPLSPYLRAEDVRRPNCL